MKIQNKVVVITGASSGIGAKMAETFAAKGAIPVLTARSITKLQENASQLSGEHAIFRMDVTDSLQVADTVKLIIEKYGRIDILINNAGFGVFENFLDTPLEQFEDMMNVNYMGIVRCTKAVLPYMLKAGSGHIVNVASIAGKLATAKSSGYTATKHAVLGLTNSLRQELVGTGVSLTAINPGPINTPFFERADPAGTYVKNISWFMLKPEKVVAEIIKAIERNRAEKNMPPIAGFGAKLSQLFPRTFDWFAYRMLNKK
ncbi:SDR family NAD(P)-dependent oxidoreductase [Paenibacillus eucommiae]|uniref:Short-subunit dehydrogenase n=1 Tax=Paenibacillus eucommiae TaxID=1355755 RepID=A0ABS4J0K2_9BACL|nr:SDR family oxidoreductase [Paenibacillus eucommiae]MBP1993369.1 short-subunit dehydrogenase [Paenibacillus eucommiae]